MLRLYARERAALLVLALSLASGTAAAQLDPASLSLLLTRAQQYLLDIRADVPGSVLTDRRGAAITTTRATSRTCDTGSGPAVIGAGLPCVEASGLSVEPARTNKLLQSQTVVTGTALTSPWGSVYSTASDFVFAANAGVAPDGTSTADSIAIPETLASKYAQVSQNFAATAASWTASIYLKKIGGTGSVVQIRLNNGTVNVGLVACTVTAEWSRCSTTATLAATAAIFYIGADTRMGGGGSATSDVTVLAWGAQVEEGAYATSYIPTLTLPVARNADQNVVSASPIPAAVASWYVRATLTPESSRAWNAAQGYAWTFGTDAAANSASLYAHTDGKLYFNVYDAAGAQRTVAATHGFSAGSTHTITACADASGVLTLYADGSPIGTASGAGTGILGAYGAVSLGSNAAAALPFGGSLRDIRIGKGCKP